MKGMCYTQSDSTGVNIGFGMTGAGCPGISVTLTRGLG